MSQNTDLTQLPVIELQGTLSQMGEQLGEATRGETQELYELRLASALLFARENGKRQWAKEDVLNIARQCLPITQNYDPDGYEEFLGIARGAGLLPEQLFVTQGLTDLRDVLAFSNQADEGCSAFIIEGNLTRDGQLLIGQNWDLQTSNLPYVRLIHRQPTDDSPQTWSLSLTGCLTLIGINDHGIAVGNTNIKTRDARRGMQYLSVLHRAVRSRTFDEAVNSITNAPRAGAHYYYVADGKGNAVGLECSAQQVAPLSAANGYLVHCNHALDATIATLEIEEPSTSTSCRQHRLSALIETHSPSITVENLQEMLADHENGEDAICRHGASGEATSTNACVIMCPETVQMYACRGHAHTGVWREVSLR